MPNVINAENNDVVRTTAFSSNPARSKVVNTHNITAKESISSNNDKSKTTVVGEGSITHK